VVVKKNIEIEFSDLAGPDAQTHFTVAVPQFADAKNVLCGNVSAF
jgi:hypothetical protein